MQKTPGLNTERDLYPGASSRETSSKSKIFAGNGYLCGGELLIFLLMYYVFLWDQTSLVGFNEIIRFT